VLPPWFGVTLFYGTDPAPDPTIFVGDLQDGKKKMFSTFFCLLLFVAIFTSFKKRSQKEVTK
jgi:hypothetical protein